MAMSWGDVITLESLTHSNVNFNLLPRCMQKDWSNFDLVYILEVGQKLKAKILLIMESVSKITACSIPKSMLTEKLAPVCSERLILQFYLAFHC